MMEQLSCNYKDIVVKKPWGYEYLVYENKDVGLWLLRIHEGERTSVHCHPRKNTGLIVLDGKAEISFLNDSFELEAPKKMMIRRGLFHSTKAISREGVYMFEIETPKIKDDLVRLKDEYGRKFTSYEGKESETQRSPDHLWLKDNDFKRGNFVFCNCNMKLEKVSHVNELSIVLDNDILMCFRGGLKSDNDDSIYQPGDVVTGLIFKHLAKEFKLRSDSLILVINK